MPRRRTKLIIGLLIIVGAIIYLIYTNFRATFLYYFTVSEAASQSEELVGKYMRIAGQVEEGTLTQEPDNGVYKFSIKEADSAIAVTYKGTIPDTFREGADVVVEGTLTQPGEFKADLVFAKCPSKYESEVEDEKMGAND